MASVSHTASFLNREAFTHRAFTHNKLLHREAFTHSKLSHTTSVYYTEHLHTVLLHMASVCTHRNWDAFTHSKLLQKKFLHRGTFLYIITTGIAAPKPDLGAKSKKTILKHFLKGLLKWKLLAPKLRKSADKSLSQPWCGHSNTIYKSSCTRQ